MNSINDYLHKESGVDSDCETVYSFEEEESSQSENEYEDEEYYEGDIDDEYYDEDYDPLYVDPREEIKRNYTVNVKVPEQCPWNKKETGKVKSMMEIIKEEEEKKKIEEKKKMEMDKISKKRKERFRNSRKSFYFKNDNTEGTKKSLLLKKMK
jgi:hypothetical protein